MNRKLWLAIPLLVFALFIVAVSWRLVSPPDTRIASKMIGQPVPEFALPAALPGKPALASGDLRGGGPRLVNLFASWCVPCIAEAPVLLELSKRGVVIDGIAIRDDPRAISRFLRENGDPFQRMGADERSQVQMALGSSGVPESFIVDGQGVIRYQHIGPIMPQDVSTILAEWEKAR